MLYITYKIHTPEFTFSWHFVNTFQFWLKSAIITDTLQEDTRAFLRILFEWQLFRILVVEGNETYVFYVFYVEYTFLLCITVFEIFKWNKGHVCLVLTATLWFCRLILCVWENVPFLRVSTPNIHFYLQQICGSCILERLHKPKCRRKFRTVLTYYCEFINLIAWVPGSLKFPVGLWFVCKSV